MYEYTYFPENKVLGLENTCSQSNSQSEDFSNSQILSICSGQFVTQVAPPTSEVASQFFMDSQLPDDSQVSHTYVFALCIKDSGIVIFHCKTGFQFINARNE